MHIQKKFSQGKYLTVLKGEIYDVVVDLRKNSKNFGKHYNIVLSSKMANQYLYLRVLHMVFIGRKKKI